MIQLLRLWICACLLFISAVPSQDFRSVAKEAIPAVVSIKVKSKGKIDPAMQFFQDDFFGHFFNMPRMDMVPQTSQATGFIVSADGYILTNNHVTTDHTEISVTLNDGREFSGKLIGDDPSTDLAVIKIDANDLPYLKLGNSDDIEVGQWVVAIGNPLGLQASLTVGVVSAKGRNDLDITTIEDFIQTDAAINRGNSGGPLLNLDSQVVGINTAIASGQNGFIGIGFSIPSNIAQHVMQQIIAGGQIQRGFMGVSLQKIDQDLAQAFDLNKTEGALVADVSKNSPAEKAGLKQGDIITKYNNKPVESIAALRNAIALMDPGTKVTLSVIRNKQTLEVPILVGSQPDKSIALGSKATSSLGITVQNGTDAGVIITQIEPQSPLTMLGVKKGAVILSVNQNKVQTADEFYQALNASEKGRPLLFLLKQGETMRYVSVRLP